MERKEQIKIATKKYREKNKEKGLSVFTRYLPKKWFALLDDKIEELKKEE